jgi:beta-lactamase regulating signal transducer with metallopeptidase domain
MTAVLTILVKASLLLLAAIGAARLLHRAPAAVSHRLWSGLFAALLALPLLALTLPGLDVPVPAAWTTPATPPPAGALKGNTPGVAGEPADRATQNPDRPRPGAAPAPGVALALPAGSPAAIPVPGTGRPTGSILLVSAWCLGALAAVGAIGFGLWRVRRLLRAAEALNDPDWQRAAAALSRRLGLRREARLLVSARVGTPMAGGTWRPFVVLPLAARRWDAERRDVVLAHEIVHLAGRDPVRHLLARLALAAYWFHPLAWLAARRASVAREQACDAAVIELGTRPSAYARILLELADAIVASPPPAGALPMVQQSLLEARLMAILNHHQRPTARRLLLVPAIGMGLLTVSVAAARPAHTARPRSVNAPAAVSRAAAGSVEPAGTTAAQANALRDEVCSSDSRSGRSFSGTMTSTEGPGGVEIRELVGRSGSEDIVQKSFGDLRVCMLARDAGPTALRPSDLITRAGYMVLEAQEAGVVQRLVVDRSGGGNPQVTWQVNGASRPVNATVTTWRERMLAVLDTTWDISTLRGQVSTLRGEISTIHGQRSTLEGQISTLRGDVSTMRGQASTVRGEESSMQGRISEVQGHLSSLHGAISSEQGAISSLDSTRAYADEQERTRIAREVADHQAAIARLQQEIKDYDADARIKAIEKERADFDADGKVAAIDAKIKAFDLDGKVAAIRKQIDALDVDGKVAAIQKQIDALDADHRIADLESRRDGELSRLKQAIAAARSGRST